MTLLAMLRHGQTQWSHERRIQGRTDIPLNDAGRAALAGRRLPDEFGALQVVSSPLKRCVGTAQALGLRDVQLEPRLVEMYWGAWEGRSLSELRAEHGDAMAENEARGLDFRPPGGESPRQVLARVTDWLAEIAAARRPTLAVCHRGVIRVVFATAYAWDLLDKPPAKLDWDALHVFDLDHAGKPAVLRLNVPLAAAPTTTPQA